MSFSRCVSESHRIFEAQGAQHEHLGLLFGSLRIAQNRSLRHLYVNFGFSEGKNGGQVKRIWFPDPRLRRGGGWPDERCRVAATGWSAIARRELP